MITIYYYCLDISMKEVDEPFVANKLNELAHQLLGEKIKLPVSINRLGDEPDLAKEVNVILHKLTNPSYTFRNCAREIFELFVRLSVFDKTCPAQLLVYCPPDNSPIANAAKKEKHTAEWGATAPVGGFLSNEYKSRIDSEDLSFMCKNFLCAVYPPKDQLKNKSTIWHEALHLLGLDECYDENTLGRNCNCETCVMQYGLPLRVDEKWPSPLCDNLCDKQKEKLQNLAMVVEAKRKK